MSSNMTGQSSFIHLKRLTLLLSASFVFIVFILIFSFTDSHNQDEFLTQIKDLRFRIEDLRRIKRSVSTELRQLGRDRTKILQDKAALLNKNEKLLNQIYNNRLLLKQLELDILANRKQQSDQVCPVDRSMAILFNPLKSLSLNDYALSNQDIQDGPLHTVGVITFEAMDQSMCPLSSRFGFTYSASTSSLNHLDLILNSHRDLTAAKTACFNILLIESQNDDFKSRLAGKNNLVINLISDTDNQPTWSNYSSTVVASPYFSKYTFRDRTDIVIPSILQPADSYNPIIESLPPHSPIERKYFASYYGYGKAKVNPNLTSHYHGNDLSALEQVLQTIHRSSVEDSFLFLYNCHPELNSRCYEQRPINLGKSIFVIVLPSRNHEIDFETNDLIYHALSKGTIPVIVGRDEIRLPFSEVIDWKRATISIPKARAPELHFILKSFSYPDLYRIKYYGRLIFERYLATSKQIIDTLINIMRIERFGHPPPAIEDIRTVTYYPNEKLRLDKNCSTTFCQDIQSDSVMNTISLETLGPREVPFPSQSFRRNYSLILNLAYDLWNNPMMSPNHLYPSLPLDPVSPSEYKFIAQDQGFRPIADGLGGSGFEFSRSLGGDHPNEQFTIVLLTYERKNLLMRTLERLKSTAFLNKVIVVWNGISQAPSPNLVWPDLGVPLEIVKVERNSLNNRFLPFNSIETDAIFSMDDDSPLRPDEIVFAFRVWRQSRDRIVGFPGRFHAWDSAQNAWVYNSNHSCELSMVLTGGAFFHKYYMYMYSYIMPNSIRSIVDKFMNCEDIAMNFLVAHLIRKPPIKVTSRWTFHCANCLTSLSEEDSHFRERHECLNMFASIYGYMPLLNTQHRSDSILFKTRLPKDKQKCFKFV